MSDRRRSTLRRWLLGAGLVALSSAPCADVSSYCSGAPNSVGPGATVRWRGPVTIERGMLVAAGAPPGAIGMFLYGFGQEQTPWGDGFRCIAGVNWILARKGVGPGGYATLDLLGEGELEDVRFLYYQIGARWSFQYLYRDPAGPGGTGFNLSDAIAVTFEP